MGFGERTRERLGRGERESVNDKNGHNYFDTWIHLYLVSVPLDFEFCYSTKYFSPLNTTLSVIY